MSRPDRPVPLRPPAWAQGWPWPTTPLASQQALPPPPARRSQPPSIERSKPPSAAHLTNPHAWTSHAPLSAAYSAAYSAGRPANNVGCRSAMSFSALVPGSRRRRRRRRRKAATMRPKDGAAPRPRRLRVEALHRAPTPAARPCWRIGRARRCAACLPALCRTRGPTTRTPAGARVLPDRQHGVVPAMRCGCSAQVDAWLAAVNPSLGASAGFEVARQRIPDLDAKQQEPA